MRSCQAGHSGGAPQIAAAPLALLPSSNSAEGSAKAPARKEVRIAMPVRWRRITSRSVRVVSSPGPGPWDLLSLVTTRPIVVPTAWRPATDVCETADSITVTAELAGVDEADLEIELYPDALIVDGFRAASGCGPEAVYHSLQIRHGQFHLEIPLPGTVDIDRSDATFENGLLRISMPKVRDGDLPPGPGAGGR